MEEKDQTKKYFKKKGGKDDLGSDGVNLTSKAVVTNGTSSSKDHSSKKRASFGEVSPMDGRLARLSSESSGRVYGRLNRYGEEEKNQQALMANELIHQLQYRQNCFRLAKEDSLAQDKYHYAAPSSALLAYNTILTGLLGTGALSFSMEIFCLISLSCGFSSATATFLQCLRAARKCDIKGESYREAEEKYRFLVSNLRKEYEGIRSKPTLNAKERAEFLKVIDGVYVDVEKACMEMSYFPSQIKVRYWILERRLTDEVSTRDPTSRYYCSRRLAWVALFPFSPFFPFLPSFSFLIFLQHAPA